MAFMFKLLSRTGVCSKSGRAARIVIGRYGYKSSFGANNGRSNRVNVELEVQHGLYLKGRAVVIIL